MAKKQLYFNSNNPKYGRMENKCALLLNYYDKTVGEMCTELNLTPPLVYRQFTRMAEKDLFLYADYCHNATPIMKYYLPDGSQGFYKIERGSKTRECDAFAFAERMGIKIEYGFIINENTYI